MFENYIQIVPTLTKKECKMIINQAEEMNLWQYSTTIGQGNRLTPSEIRDSFDCPLNNLECHDDIVEKIHQAYEWYGRLVLAAIPKQQFVMPMPLAPYSQCELESVGILRYKEGQHYQWHTDADWNVETYGHDRMFSVVTYLNDDFEDGGTEFVDKVRKPKRGSSLFFPSNWIFSHRAQKVTKGTKYVLVTWYRVSEITD